MKFFSKKKRNLKGMTLVEIIISLFIFTLMALMMVRIASVSTNLTTNANHVNRKVTVQAPLAEMQNTDGTLTELQNDNLKITVKVGANSVNVVGSQYSTAQSVEGNTFADTEADIDLEFVKVDLSKNSGDNLWIEPPAEEEEEEGSEEPEETP